MTARPMRPISQLSGCIDLLFYSEVASRQNKMLYYIAIALLTGTAVGQSTPRALTWAQHPALGWDDFKGRARRNTGEPSAVTDTGFRVQLECREGALDIRVEVEFYSNSSWVKAGRKSVELLRHEQGHFDITEL